MVSAMKALRMLYPKMIHSTCAAHGLHRVADFVKDQFDDVNELISNMKKIFTKARQYCADIILYSILIVFIFAFSGSTAKAAF